jgi:D-3-phosphoglycerate dehydrogenase
VYDPLVDAEEIDALGGEKTDLDTLLRESDYISIHAPLTPENRHMIDAAALDKMKPAAVIDVFEAEPLPPDHPLAALPNAILTPHQAWYSKEYRWEIQTRAAAEIRRVLTGEKPKHWVNPW